MTKRPTPPPMPPAPTYSGLYYARLHRELSQQDLADAGQTTKGQVSKLERGEIDLTRKWAERFATVLRMPAERILFWDKYGPPPGEDVRSEDVASEMAEPSRPRKVKLRGYVGAGSEAHFYALADEDYEEVEAPLSATDQTIALEIRGQSFGPLMDSWLVYYADVHSPVSDALIGKICVVGLSDDRILIKKIVRNGRGGYRLLSNSTEPPIEDAAVEWAALVTDMKPRG